MGMFSNEEMFLIKIIVFDMDSNVVWRVISISCSRAHSDWPLKLAIMAPVKKTKQKLILRGSSILGRGNNLFVVICSIIAI